jgi:hypothetical protein
LEFDRFDLRKKKNDQTNRRVSLKFSNPWEVVLKPAEKNKKTPQLDQVTQAYNFSLLDSTNRKEFVIGVYWIKSVFIN